MDDWRVVVHAICFEVSRGWATCWERSTEVVEGRGEGGRGRLSLLKVCSAGRRTRYREQAIARAAG